MHSSGAESRLPTALLLVPMVLQPAKGAVLVQDPRARTPNLWLSLLTSHGGSLPMNSLPLSPLPGAEVPTLLLFFPSYQVTCGLFLIVLVVPKCFCSSQLAFSANVPHVDVFFIHSSSISSYSAILIDCLLLVLFFLQSV